jgi:predicted branched-subunit amino acid permease
MFGLSILYLGTKEANTLWLATYFIGYIFGRWPGVIKVCAIGSAILLLFAVLISNNITSDFKDPFILGRALHILFAVLIFSAPLYACKGTSIGNSLKLSLLPPPKKTRKLDLLGENTRSI